MLKVEDLYKSYGKDTVLEDFNLQADRGEIIGLVGENGAGKSTLLRIIATLNRPTSGEVYIDELSYRKNYKKLRQKIGYVPQEVELWEELTVMENMRFFEELSHENRSVSELKSLLSELHLEKHDTKVKRLSGGMKRKLNLAISLIHEPELLLLDEPTAGIDLKSRIEIGKVLKALSDKGTLIIHTSHDMTEIKELCDRTVFIGKDPFYKNILTAD
ncbi:MAG TPA: ATP-binding cassette domain-containing protein [Candidatus Salinicoccus merdavium]|nr:ATP-binding cassette domain-containing protein [Candidatus Salinicoccus merdavium]